MNFLTTLAMALDTLPSEGRTLLLALLLTGALCGFSRVLPADTGSSLNVLYRKGALLALVLVPVFVYLVKIQVPVPVDEVVGFATLIPGYLAIVLLALWALGCLLHLGYLVRDAQATSAALSDVGPIHSKIEARVRHWQYRLNLKGDVRTVCAGAEQGWHVGSFFRGSRQAAVIKLPAAALNWPVGVVDALLLSQMAQLKQGSWRWLVFGRVVQALYWPAPWVATLVRELADHLQRPGLDLAAAAYRDPEGWRRDMRNLIRRSSTMKTIGVPVVGSLLRLPNSGCTLPEATDSTHSVSHGPSFEDKWADTKRRRRDKERDPYEQAYWLIAVASILVGVASTLTIVQAPPEFDPNLNIEWHEKMVRTLRDFYTDEVPVALPFEQSRDDEGLR